MALTAKSVCPLINRLSVVISTYNRPLHLERSLASIETQTVIPDEIIVADDGSEPDNSAAFRKIIEASSLNVKYVRQERDGPRIAANRNSGIRNSTGDYIYFTDADVVLFPDVLELHLRSAQQNHWVCGYVIYLAKEETDALTVEQIRAKRLEDFRGGKPAEYSALMSGTHRKFTFWSTLAKIFPFEPVLRKVTMISGNVSLFRSDLERVNGFDENFRGWGNEDDDLSLRLMLAGVRGLSVRKTARIYHLYHEPTAKPLLRHGRYVSENYPYYKRWRWGEYRVKNGLVKEDVKLK